jgi:tripartite-type tricarboxylate transporter receptor subunit TctC
MRNLANGITRLALALSAASVATLAALPAAAQQNFPNRPIRLILPFAAGSGAELVYRPIVEHMTQSLGQTVIIDNRPGGGSMVANLATKNAPPDGYTIYATSNSAVTKSVVPNPEIHVLNDYTMIAPSNIGPMLIAVNTEQIKATTIKELLEEARARPGQLNYASYGVGSGAHMFFELLANEAKIKWVHVPFQGSAQAAADTAAGRTQVTGTIIGQIMPHAKELGGSGRLRVIAISTAERSPLIPSAPGMKEAGFPELDFPLWGGYVGPKGMPRDVVARLNTVINAAIKDPKTQELYRKFGVVGIGGTPEELHRMIERELNLYIKLIRDTGIKLE